LAPGEGGPGEGAPGKGAPVQAKAGFGSAVIAAFLARGERILNLPPSLRGRKSFMYPTMGRGESYQRVRGEIAEKIRARREMVYPVNTEKLALRNYGVQARTLITPCSGFKPFALFRELGAKGLVERVVFAERSAPAIQYFRGLLACETYRDVIDFLESGLWHFGQTPERDRAYAKSLLEATLREGFSGDKRELMRCLREVGERGEFHEVDYLTDHAALLRLVDPGETFLFWHSNVWAVEDALFQFSREELRQNYETLARAFAARLGTGAWIHRTNFEVLFGDEFFRPRGVFSLGGSAISPPRPGAFEVLVRGE
jgi:hypothetical protein